jgi:hypothetical protein
MRERNATTPDFHLTLPVRVVLVLRDRQTKAGETEGKVSIGYRPFLLIDRYFDL